MMKVVHYIPTIIKHDIVSDELLTIVNVMRDKADVRLLTGKNNLKEILGKDKPDIIHVHGCWDYQSARLIGEARNKGVATILSTHGGYMPYTVQHEQPISKKAKMLTYQSNGISGADAVVASTQEELDNIMAGTTQKCTDLIPSCILNSNVAASTVAEKLLLLYKKVIDTRYRLYLSDTEKNVIRRLTHAGCSKPEFIEKATAVSASDYEAMSHEQWRRIMLYAHDEHIEDIMSKGAKQEGITIPTIDVNAIARFQVNVEKNEGIEYISDIVNNRKSLKNTIEENTKNDEAGLRRIIFMAASISMRAKNKTVSMRQLTIFFRLLQNEDYDEDRLMDLLAQVKLKKNTQRILYVLKEDLKLSEGFLPAEPTCDSKTQILREIITMS